MKRLIVLMLIPATCLLSCKKFIEQQEKNAVMNIITSGTWSVFQYSKNDSNITAAFSGYSFKFDANGVVTGKTLTTSQKGVWVADVGARTVTANFPMADTPVSYLNYVWKIVDSYEDRVVARVTDTVANTTNVLDLRKN